MRLAAHTTCAPCAMHSALFQELSVLHAVHAAFKNTIQTCFGPIRASVLVYRISYEKRQRHAKNAAGRKLLAIMAQKQSNLAVAADVATIEEMLTIADQVRRPPSHHNCTVHFLVCYASQYHHKYAACACLYLSRILFYTSCQG